MRLRRIVVLLAWLSVFPAHAQEPPAVIESFGPEGFVKNVRQVRARFSEAMTPMGDPRDRVSPFLIEAPVAGSGKWEDATHWVYDFEKDLPGGVRATFTVRPGLTTLAGRPVGGGRVFSFHTGGPAVRTSRPWEGSPRIDEEQVFILSLDCDPDEASVLESVHFRVAGIGERVGVRVIKGAERAAVLGAVRGVREQPDAPLLLLEARRRFPNGARVALVWGREVRSASGLTSEADRVLAFQVRPVFRASVECRRVNADAPCLPMTPLRLEFTAPVAWSSLRQAVLEEPGGKRHAPVREEETADHVTAVTFSGPFPEKATLRLVLPPELRDDAGRTLENRERFPLEIPLDDYPPLVKFAADFGILERNADPVLPVTVRNVEPALAGSLLEVREGDRSIHPAEVLDPDRGRRVLNPDQAREAEAMEARILRIAPDRPNQVRLWLKKMSDRSGPGGKRGEPLLAGAAGSTSLSVPRIQGARSFEVMGIPLGGPGFYVVEIRSEVLGAALLGQPRPMYVSTAALVTNLGVHFKWGAQSSLVWVTTLDDARPVGGAEVEVRDCAGEVLWRGETDADGIARPAGLPKQDELEDCLPSRLGGGLMITARKADDFSFVFSGWNDGIEPWRFNLGGYGGNLSMSAHTVLDRPLFRVGDTAHMKHFLRSQVLEGLALPGERPARLEIEHLGSDRKYEIELRWRADGSAESEWTVPFGAHLGTYRISMPLAAERYYQPRLYTGTFRVEEFRLPVLRASIQPPAEAPVAPSRLFCGLEAAYLSGGAAAGLAVRFRHQLQDSGHPAPDGFDGFVFANGPVSEGVTRTSADDYEEEGGRLPALESRELVLDKTGGARVEIADIPAIDRPKAILAEMEFPDPAGGIQTVSRRIPIYPSRWLVGVRPDDWVGARDKLKIQAAVVDVGGKPVAGAPVEVDLFTRKYYSHRSRLVGGFYGYESVVETKREGPFCRGVTDVRGLLQCEAPSPVDGNVILVARARDPEGNPSAANRGVWVAGSEGWWFDVSKDDRMDLLPEKTRYEPGETARFQVRMPFREATALVAVEREGVSDVYVRTLTAREPVVEVPIRPGYAPNVYVSVLAVRGRTGETQPTAVVDLGRPAYKLGIAGIEVGWRGHALKVEVETPRDVYQVREKVPVHIRVRRADDGRPAAGGEVAVAAVDEALLELLPNDSWDLLDAMMGRRSYSVSNATSQMHVVGKRHFGLKAVPTGGGGGREMTRELFDTLLFWKGRVPLDAGGEARIDIPLNDSLSGFRIVAVAHEGAGRFGTGSRSVRSTQDLMVIPGIPPVVRQGDRFTASFTVRNNTAAPVSIEARLGAPGLGRELPPRRLSLGADEASVVSWEIAVPRGVAELDYRVEVDASSGLRDRLRVRQEVLAHPPVRPWQATLVQLDRKERIEVERPAGAVAGQGGIEVRLQASLAGGLPGVLDYMRHYPYSCLEQEASRAVSLRDRTRWDFVMGRMPAYLDSHGLLKYFPSSRSGNVALTAYVLSLGDEAGWAVPEPVRGQLIAGLRAFLDGEIPGADAWGGRDLDIHKLMALEALSRYGIAVGDWVRTLRIDPHSWPTSALIDWRDILRREPGLPDAARRAAEVERLLGVRLDLGGTTLGFSTETGDARWWLMAEGDSNANRLILSVLDAASWQGELPRLVRGALGRQRRGRWLTTVANAWGVLALEKFSRRFEGEPVTDATAARLGGRREVWDWGKEPGGGGRLLPWPEGKGTVELEHAGEGKPWAVVTSMAAVPLEAPFENGYRVRKTMTPVVQKRQGVWSRGDIARVRLECDAQAAMGWVAINDPIPGGASILGGGLGRDSSLAVQGEEREGRAWPVFEERSREAFRAYYEYVPKGVWVVEYTMRLDNPGSFSLPPTRVEALYAPEMLGESPNAPVTILP
jgi:uncharacterized protein YfaS (alpha-2-macroglobulin family)